MDVLMIKIIFLIGLFWSIKTGNQDGENSSYTGFFTGIRDPVKGATTGVFDTDTESEIKDYKFNFAVFFFVMIAIELGLFVAIFLVYVCYGCRWETQRKQAHFNFVNVTELPQNKRKNIEMEEDDEDNSNNTRTNEKDEKEKDDEEKDNTEKDNNQNDDNEDL